MEDEIIGKRIRNKMLLFLSQQIKHQIYTFIHALGRQDEIEMLHNFSCMFSQYT